MLWSKLQNARITIKENTLIIMVDTESDYEIICMEEYQNVIKKELRDVDAFNIKVGCSSNIMTDEILEKIEEMKTVFGEDIVQTRKGGR